jgi:excinuclease ABC subunit A
VKNFTEKSTTKMEDYLQISNAHENNLKNIHVNIKKYQLIAITGVSGSGKSSFAFDTILKESQRKFFQTLSLYSRQFLSLGTRAKVSKIIGLSPAIGLAQLETFPSKTGSIASFTNLSELIGLLFAKQGHHICPTHKIPTQPATTKKIAQQICQKYSNKLIGICSPIAQDKKGAFVNKFTKLSQKGFMRVWCNEKTYLLSSPPVLSPQKKNNIKLIVDYIKIPTTVTDRLFASINLALQEGQGSLQCSISSSNGDLDNEFISYSNKSGCPICAFTFADLDQRHFSPNSLGKCQVCKGLGTKDLDQCNTCKTTGIDPLYANIYLENNNIHDIYNMKATDFLELVVSFSKNKQNKASAHKIFEEVRRILQSLIKMNLNYINIGRKLCSMSVGEFQRLRLASILIKELSGMIYVLDEPSQGLHPSEVNNLCQMLKEIVKQKNTVFIVDHDLDLIKQTDYILDFGPKGGEHGGQLLAHFPTKSSEKFKTKSPTALLLSTTDKKHPKTNHITNKKFVTIKDANCQNLQIKQVKFLKNSLNVVSGVSGAGKTSLVISTLYNSIEQNKFIHCQEIQGLDYFEQTLLIDRKPLAKNSSSFPATFLEVFNHIRTIFASQFMAKTNGFSASDFSLRSTTGRCESCEGKGYKLISMKFLDDQKIVCEACKGKRYNQTLLNVLYKNKNIAEVLSLSIKDACSFFHHKKIIDTLNIANSLGLGYLKIGQPLFSLSGGESQRLKLSKIIAKIKNKKYLLIMDEPTRGLHEEDINKLITVLKNIIIKSTIIVIDNHQELINHSEWLIVLGPKSADLGGRLVFSGAPTEY